MVVSSADGRLAKGGALVITRGLHSAEEFYSRRIADAQTLLSAAKQHAADGDAVGALAAAVGADMATLQALLWERINMAPRAPQRQLFQAAEALAEVMGLFGDDEAAGRASAADLVVAARTRMAEALDDSLAAEAASRWPSVDFLGGFAAPSASDLDASVRQRTNGLSVSEYIVDRRASAGRMMLDAQSSRVRGATSEAIRCAYESDFLSLEAYLAESAWLLGDAWLLTSISRWDLVTSAVGDLARLPDGFVDAVTLVRRTMTEALGDADGARLDEVFEPI